MSRIGSRGVSWRPLAALAAAAAAGAVAGMPATARAQPGKLSFRAGFEHATYDYGGAVDLRDLYVPLTLRYVRNRLAFRVTVPYVEVEFADPTSTNGTSTYTESGLGDTMLGLTLYDVAQSRDASIVMDLTGRIELPTADEDRGLGTGEADYSLQADFYKFLGRGALSGTLGYKFRGEPAGYAVEDTWSISLGGLYRFTGLTSGGLFLDIRASSIPGADSIRELTALISHNLDERWRVEGYLLRGFSDTSLDWGGGLSIRRNF